MNGYVQFRVKNRVMICDAHKPDNLGVVNIVTAGEIVGWNEQ